MKNQFDSWLDFDSHSNSFHNSTQHIHKPMLEDYTWQNVLKTQQKQVLNESIEVFPSVKRKYQQKFNTKIQSSTSSSPFYQDQRSDTLSSSYKIKSQQQNTIMSQKDHIKKIQEENHFLKQKVDDLSFRLRETQLQLNKLKYSGNNNIANFQSMKQTYLKEITHLFENQKGHAEETCLVFKKLRELTDFDGKLKVDLMNYFMSELLENIINDSTFYYIDSILKKKGLWKQSVTQNLRKVDEQVIEIGCLNSPSVLRDFNKNLRQALQIPGQKYKQCWRAFYSSYITLLNQGFVLQNFLRLAMGKILTYVDKQNIGRIELHFQKIKLRKDIRQLRQSWFKQIQYDEENNNNRKDDKCGKKTKIY